MSAEALERWLEAMGLSGIQAAKALGVHPNTLSRWRQTGAPVHVALACRALYHKLEPWS